MKAAPPVLSLACLAVSCGGALAHASDRGHVLLLPTGYYLTGGVLAVAASFVVLVVLPPSFLKDFARQRVALFRIGTDAHAAVSLLAFVLMCVLIAAGFLGSRDPLSNPLPLTVWTLLWVGVTLVQGLFGNLWSWINPWYGPYRLVRRLAGFEAADALLAEEAEKEPSVLRLASWSLHGISKPRQRDARESYTAYGKKDRSRWPPLGYWPAVLLFFGFAWFELVYPAPDDPARLALVVATYWAGNFACMLLVGYSAWSKRGECLSVFFGMISRLSILEFASAPGDGSGEVRLCWPGAKLHHAEPLPLSGVLFLLLALGSVSFDGLSKTFLWLGSNGINPLEFPGRSALMGVNTAGLLLTFGVLAAVFLSAVWLGELLASGTNRVIVSAGLLVWSIVPIALAYHFAHYLTSLVVNGQYALVAISDPFSKGWNLFGTAYMPVSAGVVAGARSAWVLWNLQASAIVVGHMLAVLIAHLLATRLHTEPARAILSQIPLALLMILYTVFGLWLLSTPAVG